MGTSTNSKQDDPVHEQSQPVSYSQLIRGNANFRYLWSGQIVSLFGDWFNLIASAALIAQLTQSGLAVGALFVIRMLAQFVGTQVGGAARDQEPQRCHVERNEKNVSFTFQVPKPI